MIRRFFLFFLLVSPLLNCVSFAQQPAAGKRSPKLEIYYFHPTERCPIDQSIEETTRQILKNDFAKEIKEGNIVYIVINTDDKSQSKIVSRFEINAQALYLVTRSGGKEVRNDLTEFAFSNCVSNPNKFRSRMKQEILSSVR